MSELTIVGGLTVDRFANGGTAPGGSVLHAGLASVSEGVAPTFVTVAGDEPEARAGLARLAAMGTLVRHPSPATTTYRHDETDGRRVLVLEAASEPIDADALNGIRPDGVALLAPIAHELGAAAVGALRDRLAPRLTVLLIQGWLRRLELGRPVQPLPLEAVAGELWDAFGTADAVVLSTEDLAERPADPFAQAAAVRRRVGRRPIVVLTLGPEGYLLDDPAMDRVVARVPRRIVEGVPLVGAGDTFGASLAVHLARGAPPTVAAEAATDRVISVLEGRR